MRKSLLTSAVAVAISISVTSAFANPAHHADGTPAAKGPMMQNGAMMGGNMMGGNMMGGMMMNPDMMIVMLDTDGDGSLSLEEFQNMHARMFAYLDKNKDGKLDASEFASHHAGGMNQGKSKQD